MLGDLNHHKVFGRVACHHQRHLKPRKPAIEGVGVKQEILGTFQFHFCLVAFAPQVGIDPFSARDFLSSQRGMWSDERKLSQATLFIGSAHSADGLEVARAGCSLGWVIRGQEENFGAASLLDEWLPEGSALPE